MMRPADVVSDVASPKRKMMMAKLNSWIECDNCLIWYHVLCIPAGHEVPNGDDDRDENDVPLYWKCHVRS